MRRRDFGIGGGTVQGNIHAIRRIGEVKLGKVTANKLSAIGEIYIEESHIKRIKIIGETTLVNSSFESMVNLGEIVCKGIVKGQQLKLVGDLEAECLNVELFRVGKKRHNAHLKGTIICKTIEIMIPTQIEAEFECENIISKNYLKSRKELECVNFYGFDKLKLLGINSDYIYINPMLQSKIEYLTGSKIVVAKKFNMDNKFKKIPKTIDNHRYTSSTIMDKGKIIINSIEADDIYLENVKAEYVSGNNIVIGDNCEIERLEHMGNIDVSKKSIIKNI